MQDVNISNDFRQLAHGPEKMEPPEQEAPDQVEAREEEVHEDSSLGSSSEVGEQVAGAQFYKLVLFFSSILFLV
jgi:hypothetical protein